MTTSLLQHTQSISGFQYHSTEYQGNKIIFSISQNRKKLFCTACGSFDVTPTFIKTRDIRGLKTGLKHTVLRVDIHRLRCHHCSAFRQEKLHFCPGPKSRCSNALRRTVIELRSKMSIKDLADYLDLPWATVKYLEKKHLRMKYKKIPLKDAEVIGIDEIHTGRKSKYLTIVRDLKSGAVLHVGYGKGEKGLKGFARRLKSAGTQILCAAVDMAAGYTAWLKKHFPWTKIVYDHFHVIKLMNDKVTDIRRTIMREVEDTLGRQLKNTRWILVKNNDNLSEKDRMKLKEIKSTFEDLNTAVNLRDCLREIYKQAQYSDHAETAFEFWCSLADASGISQLKTMAKTIRSKIKGITAYWDWDGLTNAAMEGFNNKIRWLIRQAYGYRDREYFRLKIFDLPETKTEKEI